MEASPQAEAVPGWLGQSIYASILLCREITPALEVCHPVRKAIEMFACIMGFILHINLLYTCPFHRHPVVAFFFYSFLHFFSRTFSICKLGFAF
jgi:hypothetical protein